MRLRSKAARRDETRALTTHRDIEIQNLDLMPSSRGGPPPRHSRLRHLTIRTRVLLLSKVAGPAQADSIAQPCAVIPGVALLSAIPVDDTRAVKGKNMKFVGFRQMFPKEEIGYWATRYLEPDQPPLMPAGISEKEITVGPILRSSLDGSQLVH